MKRECVSRQGPSNHKNRRSIKQRAVKRYEFNWCRAVQSKAKDKKVRRDEVEDGVGASSVDVSEEWGPASVVGSRTGCKRRIDNSRCAYDGGDWGWVA